MDNGTLVPISADLEAPELVVIAIPAIGGNPRKTWREYSERPYDPEKETSLFQELFGHAWVYLYDFPADWKQMKVCVLASRLLNCFVQSGLSDALSKNSPHSADLHLAAYSTGGLVLKKALLDAGRSGDPKRQCFVSKCYSVAFFGVPHHVDSPDDSIVPSSEYNYLYEPDGVAPLYICVPTYSDDTNPTTLHTEFLACMKEKKENFRRIWNFIEDWPLLANSDEWRFVSITIASLGIKLSRLIEFQVVSSRSAAPQWDDPSVEVVRVRSYHMGLSYFGNDPDAYMSYINGLRDFMVERDTQVDVLALTKSRSGRLMPTRHYLQELVKERLEHFPSEATIWIHDAATEAKSTSRSWLKLLCSRAKTPTLPNFLDKPSWMSKWNIPRHQNTRPEPYCKQFCERTSADVSTQEHPKRPSEAPSLDSLDIYPPFHLSSRTTLDQYGHPGSTHLAHQNQEQVMFKCEGTDGRLVMIDYLGCWASNSAKIIVTAFPTSHGTDLFMSILRQLERAGYKRQSLSAVELAWFIVSQAVSVWIETPRSRNSDIFGIFQVYFSGFSNTIEENIQKFISYQSKGSSREMNNSDKRKLFRGYLEMLDVEDETKTLLKLFDEQIQIMQVLSSSSARIGYSLASIFDAIREVKKYQRQALDIKDACRSDEEKYKNLFEMMTMQASLDEAYYAHHSSDTLMVFAIITVIFSPLSFFTSLYGMNVREWSSDAMNLPLKEVLPITFLLSGLVIWVALIYGFKGVRDWFKKFWLEKGYTSHVIPFMDRRERNVHYQRVRAAQDPV
ncbi:hypothetical protein F5Y19DRAFT_493274 [Xylariaceae sp. FL1651]|nr:hypothetical protein F5Y19DRAFT_493274 [Xylariaceae sp. FL1651]